MDSDEAIRAMTVTMRAADNNSNLFAQFLIGRLRKVGSYWLKQLKAELTNFDSRTGRWKN